MKARHQLEVVGITAVLLLLSIAGASLAKSEGSFVLAELPAPTVNADCTSCENCENPAQHSINGDDGWDRKYGEDDHDCLSIWGAGTCPNRHPESSLCAEQAPEAVAAVAHEEKVRLWRLLVGDEAETTDLATALADFGDLVFYNAARQAVQIRNACNPDVIEMSIPVSATQAATLTE